MRGGGIQESSIAPRIRTKIGTPMTAYRQKELRVGKSTLKGVGYGLFSRRKFKKGKCICLYKGKKIPESKLGLSRLYVMTMEDGTLLDGDPRIDPFTVDGVDIGCKGDAIAAFINESPPDTKPNCRFYMISNNRVGIYAARDIEPNEELFAYYGKDYVRSWSTHSGRGIVLPDE